ncbi:MAG: mechanosensitive ion channel [Bacteroidales bacterium]|nr:mechanosensitive ion channel [Bacteroidales bacterium]
MILQTPIIPTEDYVSKVDSVRRAAGSFAEALATDPQGAMRQLGTDMIQFGLKLMVAILIYIVGIWLIRLAKKGLRKLFEKRNTDKTVASFVSSFASVVLTVLLIVISISTLGINTTSLAALLAGGGVAIGMALSGTLQNFAGGLLILAFKPFKVGDFIEAQGYAGTVTEMSIVSTRITLPDNRSVTIPHGTLANGNINNYSRNPLRRLEWIVSMEYGTDADSFEACLRGIAAADSRILDATTPGAADIFVAVKELSANSVDFVMRAWVRRDDYWPVYFSINDTIYKELPKAGFHFPFPQLDIHFKQS